MGIGISIVTRAGPSLQVLEAKPKAQAATVYNFEVGDFHTYFVGQGGLWVHNSCDSDLIASGHAFEKHVLHNGEFAGLEIRTRQQFSDLIDSIIQNGERKPLSNGRTAYWDNSTLTVVIVNPNAGDGGTCFRPDQVRYPGRAYFDQLT